jgi:hypothetical protein
LYPSIVLLLAVARLGIKLMGGYSKKDEFTISAIEERPVAGPF